MFAKVLILTITLCLVFRGTHSQNDYSQSPTTRSLSPRQNVAITITYTASYDYATIKFLATATNNIDIYAMTEEQYNAFKIREPANMPFEYIQKYSEKGVKYFEKEITFNEPRSYIVLYNPGITSTQATYSYTGNRGKNFSTINV